MSALSDSLLCYKVACERVFTVFEGGEKKLEKPTKSKKKVAKTTAFQLTAYILKKVTIGVSLQRSLWKGQCNDLIRICNGKASIWTGIKVLSLKLWFMSISALSVLF